MAEFLKKLLGLGNKEKPENKKPLPEEDEPFEQPAPKIDLSKAGERLDTDAVEWCVEKQQSFLELLKKHDFEKVSELKDAPRYADGEYFPLIDALVVHTMLSEWECSRIMQVGSGPSTLAFRHALKARNLPAELITIDENPDFELIDIVDAHVEATLKDTPFDDFDIMQENEIVFFSTNHLDIEGSDTREAFERILPKLKAGMLIGFQGVDLPFEHDRDNLEQGWTEQHRLLDYLKNSNRIKPFFAGRWLYTEHHDELLGSLTGADAIDEVDLKPKSFWFEIVD